MKIITFRLPSQSEDRPKTLRRLDSSNLRKRCEFPENTHNQQSFNADKSITFNTQLRSDKKYQKGTVILFTYVSKRAAWIIIFTKNPNQHETCVKPYLSPVDEGLPDLPPGEHGRSLHIIPVLAGERIHTGKDNRKLVMDVISMSGGYVRRVHPPASWRRTPIWTRGVMGAMGATHIFFLTPFLPPFESPLFLPTAMVNAPCKRPMQRARRTSTPKYPFSRPRFTTMSVFD